MHARQPVGTAVGEGLCPLGLASRPAGGRGRSDRDVAPSLSATRRRVEPALSQPSVVRLRGRTESGLEGPKGQADGVSFFSGIFLDKQENTLARRARRLTLAAPRNRRAKPIPSPVNGSPFDSLA